MTDFPLMGKQDAGQFGVVYEDVGLRSDMEGGYVLTRPRHTRTPRRTWTTGFTALNQTDYATFNSFVLSFGTYATFGYTVPNTGEGVLVRFASIPEIKYVGVGTSYLWSVSCKLEEV